MAPTNGTNKVLCVEHGGPYFTPTYPSPGDVMAINGVEIKDVSTTKKQENKMPSQLMSGLASMLFLTQPRSVGRNRPRSNGPTGKKATAKKRNKAYACGR